MPDEPASLITLFVAPLNRIGVTYMVTGSLAASIYGDPRLTNDIDLVIALPEHAIAPLHDAFDRTAFYVPPTEVMTVESRRVRDGHFNIIHTTTALKADVYIMGEDPLHRWAVERRHETTIDGQSVWLAPPEYVVLRKLQYFRDGGSDKHLRDIRAMFRELGADIDRTALEAEAQRLGLEVQLAMVESA